MGYPMAAQEIVELAVDEVLASITDHGSWHSKAGEDDVGEQSPQNYIKFMYTKLYKNYTKFMYTKLYKIIQIHILVYKIVP